MSSTFAILAFSGFVAAASNPTNVAFQKEYSAARQLGREQAKPLAVFVSSGENGWEKICREPIGGDVKKLLSDSYVCVYVDRGDEAGKRLAADFEFNNGPGLVISNRTGDLQAFRHQGDMTNEVLATQLRRFADSNLVVNQTETLNATRTSFYPPNGQGYYQSYYPQYGNVGGGCANGRCR